MSKDAVPQLALPGEEKIEYGVAYQVVSCEPFTSEVQGFVGYRLVLQAEEGEPFAIPLWSRDVVGRKSKMGAFLVALGQDISAWPGQWVEFLSWEPRNREVIERTPPKK